MVRFEKLIQITKNYVELTVFNGSIFNLVQQ